MKTEGNSVEDQIFEHDISEQQDEDSLSSEYVDMEKLDDEKMAELLLDEDDDMPDQPIMLDSDSKQIIIIKPTGINFKKLRLLQADCADSLDLQKLSVGSSKQSPNIKAVKLAQKSNEIGLHHADSKDSDRILLNKPKQLKIFKFKNLSVDDPKGSEDDRSKGASKKAASRYD